MATLVAACALGAYPTHVMAGEAGLVAMGLAAALVLVGALLGYLPLMTAYARSGAEGRANSFLIGLGIRLFSTLAGVLVLGMGLVPARASFLLWAGILYAVMLVVEIVQLVRGLAPRLSPGQSPGQSSGGSGARIEGQVPTPLNALTSQVPAADVPPPASPMPHLKTSASVPVTPPKGSATA